MVAFWWFHGSDVAKDVQPTNATTFHPTHETRRPKASNQISNGRTRSNGRKGVRCFITAVFPSMMITYRTVHLGVPVIAFVICNAACSRTLHTVWPGSDLASTTLHNSNALMYGSPEDTVQ